MHYILSIDQSTQGTKALLLDEDGRLYGRRDLPHEQKISPEGWISHDPMEIYMNTLMVTQRLIIESDINPADVFAVGISNQRETCLLWDKKTGFPVMDAVVWQCSRASAICQKLARYKSAVKEKTGIPLSPYFPAPKWAWLLQNSPDLLNRDLCAGTIDTWLLFKLTGGKTFLTEYSNASRTQLFNIRKLEWDTDLCEIFGVPRRMLPEVSMSDGNFGETDLEGFLPRPVPICGVLGDSHGALFGQGCTESGMTKATYGTGSSVMMQIGDKFAESADIATSLAWGRNGKISYVLEGNINYTGAVMTWIARDLHLIDFPEEAGRTAMEADPEDETFLVPAFSGLGAPYWNSEARAMFCGMSRKTGRAELVKAAEECIAYQVTDVVNVMREISPVKLEKLRVDGGPTRDSYLMQFQSDLLDLPVSIAENEELSGIGAGYCAGIAAGFYPEDIARKMNRTTYMPTKGREWIEKHYSGWKHAVSILAKNKGEA